LEQPEDGNKLDSPCQRYKALPMPGNRQLTFWLVTGEPVANDTRATPYGCFWMRLSPVAPPRK